MTARDLMLPALLEVAEVLPVEGVAQGYNRAEDPDLTAETIVVPVLQAVTLALY